MNKILLGALFVVLAVLLVWVIAGSNQEEEMAEDQMKSENQIVDEYGNIVPEGCESWFDGCNNCMVSTEPGMPMACTRMFCEVTEEPKCMK